VNETRRAFPFGFLLPALTLAFLVWAFPLFYSLVLSFTDAVPGATGQFLGLTNFQRALADPRFGHALSVSFLFAAGAVLLHVGIGFGLAAAFYRRRGQRTWLQLALLLPWTVSEIAAALIWYEFLNQDSGLFNWLLTEIGLPALPWKTNTAAAMLALWVASLWHGLAFSTLLQMAGLTSLPPNLIAAARLDGASGGQILRRILWPHQRRMVAANALLVWLSAMVTFSLPFALTAGGPLRATEMVSLYTYNTAFGGRFELGYASALGLVVLAIYAVFAALYVRSRRPA